MFRRKADKAKSQSRGNDDDPFGLNFDPNSLKFDNDALEKELADIIGEENIDTDEEELKVEDSPRRPKIQPKKQESDDEFELLQQLQSELRVDDTKSEEGTPKSEEVPEESPQSKSSPSPPPLPLGGEESLPPSTTETNDSLLKILERKSAFENVINSMNSSPDLSDIDRAYLHRCERLLTSINAMADQAKNKIPVDLNDLPPLPSPNEQPPLFLF
ncbi:hypothetical protein Aperf_G00000001960 [Anoplocephala perfoliata]